MSIRVIDHPQAYNGLLCLFCRPGKMMSLIMTKTDIDWLLDAQVVLGEQNVGGLKSDCN